jgi:hypothetical protein
MYQFNNIPSLQVFKFNIRFVAKSFEFKLVTWISKYLERHKDNNRGLMKQHYKVLETEILAKITAFPVDGWHTSFIIISTSYISMRMSEHRRNMVSILLNGKLQRTYYMDRLCGLVVRVSGYRSRGPGFDFRRYQIFGSGTGSTQPREDNWGATWMKK